MKPRELIALAFAVAALAAYQWRPSWAAAAVYGIAAALFFAERWIAANGEVAGLRTEVRAHADEVAKLRAELKATNDALKTVSGAQKLQARVF